MAKTERCPICNVPVKPENMVRHVDDNHPRHPDAAAIRQEIKQDTRYAPRRATGSFRVRRTHVAVVAVVVLVGAGLYYAAPFFDPYYGFNRDSCISESFVRYHLHQWVQVVIDGTPRNIPGNVGHEPCLKPLHTHDENPSGPFGYPDGEVDSQFGRKIHLEAPVQRDFTLGDFFAIWGQTLTPTQVLDCSASSGRVIEMTVNNSPSAAFGNLVLQEGQVIRITCAPAP